MGWPDRCKAEPVVVGSHPALAFIWPDSRIHLSHIPTRVPSSEISTASAHASDRNPRGPTRRVVREGYTRTYQLENKLATPHQRAIRVIKELTAKYTVKRDNTGRLI